MTEITEAKEDPPSGRHFRTFGHGSFGGCCQLEKVCLDGESILLLPRTAHSENPLALSQTLSLSLFLPRQSFHIRLSVSTVPKRSTIICPTFFSFSILPLCLSFT